MGEDASKSLSSSVTRKTRNEICQSWPFVVLIGGWESKPYDFPCALCSFMMAKLLLSNNNYDKNNNDDENDDDDERIDDNPGISETPSKVLFNTPMRVSLKDEWVT